MYHTSHVGVHDIHDMLHVYQNGNGRATHALLTRNNPIFNVSVHVMTPQLPWDQVVSKVSDMMVLMIYFYRRAVASALICNFLTAIIFGYLALNRVIQCKKQHLSSSTGSPGFISTARRRTHS